MQGRVLLSVCVMIVTGCHVTLAQNSFDEFRKEAKADFDKYRKQSQRDFATYRDNVNREFAEYLRKDWIRHESSPATPPPLRPEPPVPVIKEPDKEPTTDPVLFDNVILEPEPDEQPQPIVQPSVPDEPVKPLFSFQFYGCSCAVPLEQQHRFSLPDVSEKSVADAWEKLSTSVYIPVISACLELRSQLRLCDWAYFRMLELMTTSFFTPSYNNEARLMQMFILTQSGYKVRIGRIDNRLALMLPSKEQIYNYSFLIIGGDNYYIIEDKDNLGSVYLLDAEYPGERYLSLQINMLPDLPISETPGRMFKSGHCDEASAQVRENKNLIDFFSDYPRYSNWNFFVKASMSDYAKSQLYPELKKAIDGKGQREAANILLQWVQTAFEYKTDQQQFGYERPLYADETLFYPYCDCEDRAILYSVLIGELLGLDVVMLQYPEHLATAVAFTESVAGDYLTVDGKRYTVCDPTYINSSVGDVMPQFKSTTVSVVKL